MAGNLFARSTHLQGIELKLRLVTRHQAVGCLFVPLSRLDQCQENAELEICAHSYTGDS